MERIKIMAFAAAQDVWLLVRTLGRAVLGKERFDRLIDRTGLHELKNRSWRASLMLPDGNVLLYRPQDPSVVDEVYGRDVYGRERIPTGGTVVDAGAHIGAFTLMAARRVGPAGRVLSFEPSPGTQEVLRSNVRFNGLSWVKIFPAALADASGTAPFYVASATAESPFSDTLTPLPGRAQVEVPVRRLDDVLAEEGITSVDLLKMDVEGAELRLLEGASKTLARTQRVVMEVHRPRVDPAEVRRRLEGLGFSCRVITYGDTVILEAVRPHPAD